MQLLPAVYGFSTRNIITYHNSFVKPFFDKNQKKLLLFGCRVPEYSNILYMIKNNINRFFSMTDLYD